jgi:hypothetical protein
MDTPVVHVELPADLYAELESMAVQDKAKDAVDMIARLVADAHSHKAYPESVTPAFRRILDRAADLGVTDLAEQHDHYLYNLRDNHDYSTQSKF